MPDASPDRAIVDERVALWAARLVLPPSSPDPARVADLRRDIGRDMREVDAAARQWAQLGVDLPPTEGRVVGRLGWVRANLAAIRGAFDPLAARLERRRAVASRVLGAQIGTLLGLMSTKVLGQYVLPLGGVGGGQLVIVGPNLLSLADEHGPVAADIRRSVLVHEVTHRLQFDGAPWLGDHLRGLLRRYLEGTRLDAAALMGVAADLPGAVSRVVTTGSVTPLLEAVLTDEQYGVIMEAQGLMSLLEGHGNAAMYLGSGPVVDDAEAVREALDSRRGDVTSKILAAVAGLDMKRRQYAEGEQFVRTVVDRAGIPGLNRAFDAPELLPGPDDIADPDAWLRRVGAVA
jgi:coenzyme F420 biosynthesis associated uncharacterized protein